MELFIGLSYCVKNKDHFFNQLLCIYRRMHVGFTAVPAMVFIKAIK